MKRGSVSGLEVALPKGRAPIKSALQVSKVTWSPHVSPCCLNGSYSVLCPPNLGVSHSQPHSTSSGCGSYPPIPDTQPRVWLSIQPVRAAHQRRCNDSLLNRIALSGRPRAPYMGCFQNWTRVAHADFVRPCQFANHPPAVRPDVAHLPPVVRISSLLAFRSFSLSKYKGMFSVKAEMKTGWMKDYNSLINPLAFG